MRIKTKILLISFMILTVSTIPITSIGTFEIRDENLISIVDSYGREVPLPEDVNSIICSGPGALRLATYLQVTDRVIAVDDIESGREMFAARPYILAHPELKELPIFGEFRGKDNPELILSLEKRPQVIFKTFPESGYDGQELMDRTGIPVVTLAYGDLLSGREDLYGSLRLMGRILGVSDRAEEVIAFFDKTLAELEVLSSGSAGSPSSYIGGIAYKGTRGITSTEQQYPPFVFTKTNAVLEAAKTTRQIDISKEQILSWDPEIIFIDISSILSGDESNSIYELQHREYYQHLQAVHDGRVYGVLPYNLYTQNFGSILADAYYIGTIVHEENFSGIDPELKADEIYEFLLGEKVFSLVNEACRDLAFERLPL